MKTCIDCNNETDVTKLERCVNCYLGYKASTYPKKKCECSDKCEVIIPIKSKNGKPQKYAPRHNPKGNRSKIYRSGRCKLQGYWYILMPEYFSSYDNGYVREHIYNYQEYHKCCMLPWGEVHHIDENTENNMIWNLKGMMNRDHQNIHHIKDTSGRRCSECGTSITSVIKKNNRFVWHSDKKGGWLCHICFMKDYYENNKKTTIHLS
jgi:hypothetical protein